MHEKDTGNARKSECISKIKDTIEKPPDYENVFKRNGLGDPQKCPKRKRPSACKTLSSKNIWYPGKIFQMLSKINFPIIDKNIPQRRSKNFCKNLFIQISRATSTKFPDGVQWGGSLLYIAFERHKP